MKKLHYHLRQESTVKIPTPPPDAKQVVEAVGNMYHQFPFPPPQRKHTYRQHAVFVHQLLKKLQINPKGKLFGDIACGTGLMMLDYALEFPETRFIGYDISSKSVDLANKYFQKAGIGNRVHSFIKDITKLKDKEEFSYIVSWGTIHHLPNPKEGIHILCRALKPNGVLRTGIYGYYGNWERRIQLEIVDTILDNSMDFSTKIKIVQAWAKGDKTFKNTHTAPPVDIEDKTWVVDEFLHVWEQHLRLKDIVEWLTNEGMRIICLTDYYDKIISLNISDYSSNSVFIKRVERLSFPEHCHLIDLITRPYWISLFAQKV